METEKPTGKDGEAGSERSIEIIHDVPRIPLIPTAVAPVPPGSLTHERIPTDRGKKRRGRALPLDKFSGEDPTVLLDDWLPSLSWVADWYSWSEQETLIQLAGHLRGKAFHEWNLLSWKEKSSYAEAVKHLQNKLVSGARIYAAQDFRRTIQEDKESVSSYIQRLERAFVVAYGRDELTDETKNTMLHSQLQEGLRYDIMRSPAVTGSQSYKELVAAARNEENRQAQLRQRQQQVVKSSGPHQPPRTQTANVQPSKSDIRCYTCGVFGHYKSECKTKKSESTGKNKSSTLATTKTIHTTDRLIQQDVASILFPSSDSSESLESDPEICTVRVSDQGNHLRVAQVDVHGVSVSGLVDTGADITIMNGETFREVASVAYLKKKHVKAADKTPHGYDQQPFKLDGKMDLDIQFNEKMIRVPVYVKHDAKDPLLLSEGVCQQLGILTYHPDVQPLKRICQKLRGTR